MLFSTSIFAGEWTEPLKIKEVSYTSSEGTFASKQLRAYFYTPPTTQTCVTTGNFAVYPSSGPDTWDERWLSMLMAAQAQNKKVRVYIVNCVSNTPRLYGVKILSE